jgi:hypothetical protein
MSGSLTGAFGTHKGIHMIPRASPGRSVRELIDAKTRIGKELRAAGYLYDNRTLIFSSITDIAECGPVQLLGIDDSDEEIGLSICDRLLESGRHDPGNIRDHKLSDWKAFVASGAKSSKHFEASSLYFSMETVNSAIILRARHRLSLEPSFWMSATLSNGQTHDVFGAAIKRLVRGVKTLRDAGVL